MGGARACLHAETRASLTGRTKTRPGTSSIWCRRATKSTREGVAPPRFCFFFPPRAESGPGSSPPPPPFPVRPPRGSRTPRGNGGPQSGFVGQNLVFWIIALEVRGRVSNKISGLLEGLSLATCGPMHSQRPDCIGALHFAFASRPYRPCTCLGADLLCAVRRLRPGFPAHEHDHPANADVSAVRTKSEVLVHAMRAETTEALVVCSEHVGSTPEQANAVLPVRLPLFGLVTRGVAEKE